MHSALRGRLVLLLSVLVPSLAVAQINTGSLSGTVLDTSQAAIPNATVTATDQGTNASSSVKTNDLGLYSFPSLRPGTYRLEAEAPGFKRLVREGLDIQVASGIRVDLTLEVGTATETVTVGAAAPLVESDNAALGTTITNRQIIDLPINGRNPFTLVSLAAGVTTAGVYAGGQTEDFTSAANFMVNGGRAASSEMLIDGITNTVPIANPISLVAIFPSIDMLQEFKMQSNNFSAEFGRSGNGVLNMILKSGTNEFHGTAYEFLRNSTLDANNFFSNRNGIPLASYKRNQFGFSFGGPIIKDKLFFFTNYEWQRIRSAGNTTATVPTVLEAAGDFSRTRVLVGGSCVPVQIYDPFSTRQTSPGVYVRTQFPGNVIPARMLNSVGQILVGYLPRPTSAGSPCTGANNFYAVGSNRTDVDQWDGKFDWVPTSNDRLTLGLSYRDSESIAPNYYGNISQSGGLSGLRGDGMPAKGGRVEYTRTVTPSLLIGGRFGVTRGTRYTPPNAPPGFSLTSLGFPTSLAAEAVQPQTFPRVTYSGYAAQGPSLTQFISQEGTAYSFDVYATKVSGRHTIKTGWEYRIDQSGEISGINASGNYAFSQSFTQGPNPFVAATQSGNAIASALLGTGTGSMDIWPAILTSNWYTAAYVQDDIKVNRNLTLNLGLRYDLESGRKERYDQLSFFNFTAPNPVGPRVGLPLAGGLEFVNKNGNSKYQSNFDSNNFGPRFGFAYSFDPKSVVRGGYGIFYTEFPGSAAGVVSGISGFQVSTPWVSSLDNVTPLNLISNPFPTGLARPTGSSLGLATNVGLSVDAVDRGNKTSYVQSWDFTVQRELPYRIGLEAAYVGNKGTDLGDNNLALNQLHASYMALGTRLSQLVPNPFYGLVTVGTLSQPTVAYGQLLKPYPQFINVNDLRPSIASSIYHGLNLTAQKRMTHGFMVQFTYSFSKLIDDASAVVTFLGPTGFHQDVYNRRADRSTDPMDISQRANISAIWELPFGHGRAFGANTPALLDALLGGWQLNGIAVFSRGYPLAFSTATNTTGIFNAGQRPNATGQYLGMPDGRSKDQMIAQYFNTATIALPPSFTFGNVGRTSQLRAPGFANYDLSLFKTFRIGERVKAEFRGEFFNTFNYVQLGAPNTTAGSNTFGQISTQANTPRQGQVALKLRF